MKRSLLRNVCLCARTRLLSPPCHIPIPKTQLGHPLAASTWPRHSFYSTESPSPKKEASNGAGDDGVSNEELKMRIDSYYSGNQEALPSIFEAILKRQLAGKDEETDEKLMEEILGHGQEPLSDIEDEVEADADEFPGSDLEI
ncbi:uncharacterized protein LOC103937802 [Pyrus x bretschneideri]|uniref:uncharacterized protein LOC103937802 n=1 Tax=Pyrus x bretschneideri TaxID=225117 RepID=UPI00202E3CB7|nr:uncharacterized protein LOC103937802 [Pyrus x bretschneideri]